MFNLSSAIGYLVGFLYPAYRSFKAIETPETNDDVQLLTYWVVYAFFNLFEFFGDYIISWLPFYYELKIVALIFLQYNNGAAAIYTGYVRPFLIAHEKEIDSNISSLGRNALNASKKVYEKAPQLINTATQFYEKNKGALGQTEEKK